SATSRGSETIHSGRKPAARMLEERCQGRQAPVHDTRAGRVYAAPGKAETAAGGGSRMRRGVAVGMGCALVLAGVAAAQARGERELTNDELRAEMARNSALAVYVKRNGVPDVAEAHFLADEPPWDDHEVTPRRPPRPPARSRWPASAPMSAPSAPPRAPRTRRDASRQPPTRPSARPTARRRSPRTRSTCSTAACGSSARRMRALRWDGA